MAPIKVGLMGYGFSTKCFHLPFILPNPDLQVYAFLQRAPAPSDPSKAEAGSHCTVDYPDAKHYRTADEFFADPAIELVVVCTHHDTHGDFAIRSLKAGKHVVVEKPFTATSQEADRVLAAAKDSEKTLTVFQNRRYDSDFRTLQDLVNRKAFGKITEAEIHYDVDFPFWVGRWTKTKYEPGDGMMFGLGSHTFDQALTLFGKPKSVTGFYRTLRDAESEVDDTFTTILQYGGDQSKLVVTVKTSVVATMRYPLKYFVRGYDGTFIKYGDDAQEQQIFAGMKPGQPGFGVESEDTWGELTTKKQFIKEQSEDSKSGKWVGRVPSLNGEYASYYTDVVKALRGENELVIKPQQSRDATRISELARQSSDEGRTLNFD